MAKLPAWVRNPQDDTDVRLIERAAANDQRGWEELYACYSAKVRQYCRQRGLAEADAEDVCQEVFWSVSKSIARFRRERPRDSFRGWLYTIAARRVADFFRWSEKDVLRRAEHERDLTNLACFIEGPQTQEQRDRLAAALRRVRQRVRARTWRVFTANVLRGRPIGEVAEAYGVECMSVRTTRARVLRYVLRELGEYANRGVDPEDREP